LVGYLLKFPNSTNIPCVYLQCGRRIKNSFLGRIGCEILKRSHTSRGALQGCSGIDLFKFNDAMMKHDSARGANTITQWNSLLVNLQGVQTQWWKQYIQVGAVNLERTYWLTISKLSMLDVRIANIFYYIWNFRKYFKNNVIFLLKTDYDLIFLAE
jgi:hypothetical protein